MSNYKNSVAFTVNNTPFECFGASPSEKYVPLCLDWDEKPEFGPTLTRAVEDCTRICAILPEAGRPAIYKTGHGIHAVFPNLVRRQDFNAILILFAFEGGSAYACTPLLPNAWTGGTVCQGFASICLTDGPTLRVGRKHGRGRDIKRITARSNTDSPLLRVHDAMVRRYNHKGIKAKLVANCGGDEAFF